MRHLPLAPVLQSPITSSSFSQTALHQQRRCGAQACIGVAIGNTNDQQWSVPVDDALAAKQRLQRRTSQRAELLAASEVLRKISEAGRIKHPPENLQHGFAAACWVVASDSEYVVKGMMEWLPVWKVSLRVTHPHRPISECSSGQYMMHRMRCEAYEAVEPRSVSAPRSFTAEQFSKRRVKIGFWHIRREYNELAHSLAKRVAREATAEQDMSW
jgi:ribonuclease HI